MKAVFTPPRKTARISFIRTLACCCGFASLYAGHAAADICAYENNSGQTLYTNVSPGTGWKKRECFSTAEPSATARKSGAASSRGTLAKVPLEKQKERDAMRRKVIADELATESQLLEEARAAYANGAPAPLSEEFLNPQKYAARIARLRESLDLHERNVEALKKEIAKM